MNNAVLWDVTPCCSCNNRRFEGTYRLHHQGDKNRRARKNVSSNQQPTHAGKKYYIVPSSPIISTLIMEAKLLLKRRFFEELHGVTSQKTAFCRI
jgi:hypothetical protein